MLTIISVDNVVDAVEASPFGLTEAYGQPVLFIIDEIDRMRDVRGLSGFIKAASTEDLKFLPVGIASNLSDLLADHLSLERSIIPVHLPEMTEPELAEIITKAESHLRKKKIEIEFDEFAVQELSECASGFPWFVHVIGQYALLSAYEQQKYLIDQMDIREAMSGITETRFAQHFSDIYQKAVRDSPQREMVLRMFASWQALDIPTADVYWILKNYLEIANPSQYKVHLSNDKYGNVIINPTFQEKGLVRFSNEMFKAYVRIRPSLYKGIDKRVNSAFLKWHETVIQNL